VRSATSVAARVRRRHWPASSFESSLSWKPLSLSASDATLDLFGRSGRWIVGSVAGVSAATMKTSEGTIELELFSDEAPKTVENFTKLAADGYYDGLTFHRVIPDFMIQAGCPRGDGSGGPGYTFEDEFNEHPVARGYLAMANAGPDTNGSQFFIVTADACPWLDGKHTVFGRITAGQDVADRISLVERGAGDRPLEPVLIESVELT
jgi:cyclophilin family peptidyl-prolyl cis-trans isomerase